MHSLCSDGYSLVGRYTDGRRFWNNIHKFYNNSSWDTAGARPCGKSNVIMIEWSLMHSWAKYDLPMLYTQSQHGTGWNCFCCRLAIPSGNLSVHKTNTKQQKHWWLNRLPPALALHDDMWSRSMIIQCLMIEFHILSNTILFYWISSLSEEWQSIGANLHRFRQICA